MTPAPDRQYDDDGKVTFMRRPNSALEAEARCNTKRVEDGDTWDETRDWSPWSEARRKGVHPT